MNFPFWIFQFLNFPQNFPLFLFCPSVPFFSPTLDLPTLRIFAFFILFYFLFAILFFNSISISIFCFLNLNFSEFSFLQVRFRHCPFSPDFFLPPPFPILRICDSPDRRLQVPFFFLLSLLLYYFPTNSTRLLGFTTHRAISTLCASLRSRSTFHPNPGV